MPSGQLMTMPVLIVNMGGEMVYILEQRLQAQKIPDEKGQKVLNDVVRTMYYPRFIEELFKPQEMYSVSSTRQIFDRLAHSSIMRLNESSMDKLFDLMAMGFKYQIIAANTPQELLDITNNHLDVLRRLVGSSAQVTELLEECIRQTQVAYGAMPLSEFNLMRQSLCNFFQDRKVKVSLFLHDQTQSGDGSIVVPPGGTLSVGGFVPGTVRYFATGAETGRTSLPVVTAGVVKPATGVRTHLGLNVYAKDRVAPEAPAAAMASASAASPSAAGHDEGAISATAAAAVGELNMLASLIGAPAPAASETFKLESLFGAGVFAPGAGFASHGAEIIEIDGTAPSAHRAGLDAIRSSMDLGAPGVDQGPEDDLLDLMDRA